MDNINVQKCGQDLQDLGTPLALSYSRFSLQVFRLSFTFSHVITRFIILAVILFSVPYSSSARVRGVCLLNVIVSAHGPPVNETNYMSKKSQKLRDMKIEVTVVTPNDPERESFVKSFLSTTKVAKVKMMLRRQLKINAAATITLSCYTKVWARYYICFGKSV